MSIPNRRVVLRHLTGPLEGLDQIIGEIAIADPPTKLENIDLSGHTGSAALIGIQPNYIHYREISDGL